MSILDGITSLLGDNSNRVTAQADEPKEGIGDLAPELSLETDDDELIELKNKWKKDFDNFYSTLKKKQEECEHYYLGKQYHNSQNLAYRANPSESQRPLVDNVIFEAVETFLPQATKQNPEPVVSPEQSRFEQDDPSTLEFASSLKELLVEEADRQRLRLQLKKVTRYWAMYFLGVAKISYDVEAQCIKTTPLRTQKVILDPSSTIEEGGVYTGQYIGEYKEESAAMIIEKFPEHEDMIRGVVKDNMGTKITYIEWWTNEIVFFTFRNTVLGKFKNPHWDYGRSKDFIDDFGNAQVRFVEPKNHFRSPQMPYVFLSIFNLGKHPYDDTSLVYQNLSNQDLLNKRIKQIDKNADQMNNGIVLSGDAFTKDQAKRAGDALADGGYLWVPNGDVGRAYRRDQAPALPSDVFNQMVDIRQQLKNIFGITGLTPQGIQGDRTVRGKILTQSADTSRIGGGVSEYIEQMADRIFNWWVQMIYIYEPEKLEGLNKTSVLVSVKEGSLIPKDDLTLRNEAIDLWAAGAMDILTLMERLDMPDPEEAAKRLLTFKSNPEQYAAEYLGVEPAAPPDIQPTQTQPLPAPNELDQVPLL